MEPKPKAVTVVATFLFVATGIALVVGVSLLFPNPMMDRLWELNKQGALAFRAVGRISGVPLLLLGIGTFFAAKGLLRGRAWAWWFAMVLFTVDAIGDIVSFVITRDWMKSAAGIVISSIFLWL